jgi:hypothetical protein
MDPEVGIAIGSSPASRFRCTRADLPSTFRRPRALNSRYGSSRRGPVYTEQIGEKARRIDGRHQLLSLCVIPDSFTFRSRISRTLGFARFSRTSARADNAIGATGQATNMARIFGPELFWFPLLKRSAFHLANRDHLPRVRLSLRSPISVPGLPPSISSSSRRVPLNESYSRAG